MILELGLKRCESVLFLSKLNFENYGILSSMRRPVKESLWYRVVLKEHCVIATLYVIKIESIYF